MYRQQEPQIYACHIPADVSHNDYLYRLSQGVDIHHQDPPCDVLFSSKGGQAFRLMAKNKHWNNDFWPNLVGPHLGVDLNVETWRRDKTDRDTQDSDHAHDVEIVRAIDLKALHPEYNYGWPNSKDHAKWAVSREGNWVCVADINLDRSQEKRGGGAICFQHMLLWQSLSQIESLK